MKCYYFGCRSKGDIGHYIFTNDGVRLNPFDGLVGVLHVRCLDGMIKEGNQSEAHLYFIGGWTFLTMSDFSADSRPASNATFMSPGNLSFDELMILARKAWPFAVKRIESASPITLVNTDNTEVSTTEAD